MKYRLFDRASFVLSILSLTTLAACGGGGSGGGGGGGTVANPPLQTVAGFALLSATTSGQASDNLSFGVDLSEDGRFALFLSNSSNLVASDTNNSLDVFRRDSATNQIVRVSESSANAEANAGSSSAAMSSDGRFVAFISGASNLVAGDGNNTDDVFLKDLSNNNCTRLSLSTGGAEANDTSLELSMSGDGRLVVFSSLASNLVAADTNNATDIFVRDTQTNMTTRVNLGPASAEANGASDSPRISKDGRFVAFVSDASNLVMNDTNGAPDIFVRDLQMNTTVRVSVDSAGAESNGVAFGPSLSRDGRFVSFVSSASNLVNGDSNGRDDVFRRDLMLNQTIRVSVGNMAVEANGNASEGRLSGDGRFVLFTSVASNLASGDDNARNDVFVRDTERAETRLVSVNEDGFLLPLGASLPVLSDDGRRLAFTTLSSVSSLDSNNQGDFAGRLNASAGVSALTLSSVDSVGTKGNGDSLSADVSGQAFVVCFASDASNLVANDSLGFRDVFVRNAGLSRTVRASEDASGTEANGLSEAPALSEDGFVVAFESEASNLVTGDSNNQRDVFVKSLLDQSIVRVSVNSQGQEVNGDSFAARLSADGRYVVFESDASDLVTTDGNGLRDVFRHDRMTGVTVRVSVDAQGQDSDGASGQAAISADGRFVAFQSMATDLVASDGNGVADVFLRDMQNNTTQRLSLDSAGVEANAASARPRLTADGRLLVFQSEASNLVSQDGNSQQDIFLKDRITGICVRVNVSDAGVEANGLSLNPQVSRDGGFVSFLSEASNLVSADGNGVRDAFVFDTNAQTVARVNLDASGAVTGAPGVQSVALSADGQSVAFVTAANLNAGDTADADVGVRPRS